MLGRGGQAGLHCKETRCRRIGSGHGRRVGDCQLYTLHLVTDGLLCGGGWLEGLLGKRSCPAPGLCWHPKAGSAAQPCTLPEPAAQMPHPTCSIPLALSASRTQEARCPHSLRGSLKVTSRPVHFSGSLGWVEGHRDSGVVSGMGWGEVETGLRRTA